MIHQGCLQPLNLWQVVKAAAGDSYRLKADGVHVDHFRLGYLGCRLAGKVEVGSARTSESITPDLTHGHASLHLQAREPWLYL